MELCRHETNSFSDDDREGVRLGTEGCVLVIEDYDDDEEHHDGFHGDVGCDLDLVERMLVMMLVLLLLLLLPLLLLMLVW